MSNQQLLSNTENALSGGTGSTSLSYPWRDMAVLSGVFVLALCGRLWFNFVDNHVSCAAAGDAWEYLSNARSLLALTKLPDNFWGDAWSCLTGIAPASVQAHLLAFIQPLSGLSISGPVYPLFLSGCLLLSGNVFDLQLPVAAQCVLSALTCSLICLLGMSAWSPRVALAAGVAAAIYPGFIINSGRLITETSALFLVVLLLVAVARGFRPYGGSFRQLFCVGILACLLQFTRSAMSLLSLCLLPLVCLQNRRRKPLLSLLVLLAGFAFIALPWLAWQKVAVGRASLVIDRVSHLNFSVGNNVGREGWYGVPYADFSCVEDKSLTKLLKENFRQDPCGWVELTFSKIPRLAKFPWNDFRSSVGPVDFHLQVVVHQALLLLAAWGLILALIPGSREIPASRQQIGCRLLILGVIALHLLYVAFIGQPRYFVTAMPFVILFSAAGLVSLLDLLFHGPDRRTPLLALASGIIFFLTARLDFMGDLPTGHGGTFNLIAGVLLKGAALVAFIIFAFRAARAFKGSRRALAAVATACGILIFPSACLPLKAHGRTGQWQCSLDKPGESVTQWLPTPQKAPGGAGGRQYYLMIDSRGWQPLADGLTIRVGGRQLSGPLIPGIALMDRENRFEDHGGAEVFLPYEYIFNCLTSAAGITPAELRQWFLIPLRSELVDGPLIKVELSKEDSRPFTVFGSSVGQDGRMIIPGPERASWDKAFYGVENDRGFNDCRYDELMAVSAGGLEPGSQALDARPGAMPAGSVGGRQAFVRLLSTCLADRAASHLSEILSVPIKVESLALPAKPSDCISVCTIPSYRRGDLWLVRIRGQVMSQGGSSLPGLTLVINSVDKAGVAHSYDCPWAPRAVRRTDSWTRFDLAFPFAPDKFPGKLSSLQAKFFVASPVLAQMTRPLPECSKAEFKDVQLEISSLSGHPLADGWQIY